jgi:xanthine dehydrogenase iron-sulfur cluster and FAD-binding subunit A
VGQYLKLLGRVQTTSSPKSKLRIVTHTQYAMVGQYPILVKLWEGPLSQNVSNLGTVAHNIFHCGAVPEIVGQSSNHFLTLNYSE